MSHFTTTLLVVLAVAAVMVAIAVVAILWARAATRRARTQARVSPTGSAGTPPLTSVPGDDQSGMWQPQDSAFEGWIWAGGRAQPPDVLSGRHAVHDSVVVREVRGTFRGRAAFSHVRRLQRLPVVQRAAPQTHWSKVTGLESTIRLPRFFALTAQPRLVASTRILDAADGLEKTLDALGPGTILWAEPQWTARLAQALRPVLEQGTPEALFFAAESSTLYVCASRGEDEDSVRQRLQWGDEALRALEEREEKKAAD